MSMTLGEKLRQAREERGITLSEVAEQTRISPLYLESIDNDDYRKLPGGIFNRGFVKSYAKYVGLDEQEALLDYSRLLNEGESVPEEPARTYRPEVLTDERASSSNAPTIIMAVVILAAMTAGILFLVNYLRKPAEPASDQAARQPASVEATPLPTPETALSSAPSMETVKVEFRALNDPVSLTATSDGKVSTNVVAAGSSMTFDPKEALKLSYSKSLAQSVQLVINGKSITPPAAPFNPKRAVIEFEINKDNLAQIWNSGSITPETIAVPEASPATPITQASPAAHPSPAGRTTPQSNTAPRPAETPKPQPKPAMTARPAPANRPPQ